MIVDQHAGTDDAAPVGAGSRRLEAALTVGFLSVGADGTLVDCNASAERLFGRRRDELIGQRSWEVAGLGHKTSFGGMIHRVAAEHVPEDAEIVLRGERGEKLLAVHALPTATGVDVEWSDITAARTAELRLALSEARHEEAADGMPAAAWLSRADGALIYVNRVLVEALGRPRHELLGHRWIEAIDPEDRPEFLAVRSAARAEHSSVQYEGRFLRPDGAARRIQLYGRPRFDFRGEFCGHVGLAKDVTEMRETQARQAALVNELNHRVKNTLATVQSLVRHTLREHGAPRETERAVVERVMALSAAHDVLNRDCWTGADVTDLVQELLAPYGCPGRIGAAGPHLRISPRSAIALAMGLRELAAGAVAHGALSTPEGHVELDWREDGDRVALEWREIGGPPAAAAAQASGFGALLLGRLLAADLGEPAEMVQTPDGLICRMRAAVHPSPAATLGSSGPA
jgi:PAS domain S-box-containing protein